MPRKCAAFGCRGNYAGEPYSRLVSFPKNEEEKEKWIKAMPNERKTLESKKEIWICASHFDCEWITIRGGKRPSQPPSIFAVPKSCLKQVQESKRTTQKSTAEARLQQQQQTINEKDKIISFENFVQKINVNAPSFYYIKKEHELSLFSIGDDGRCVTMFLKFREADSKFGFLQLVEAEKKGIEVKKSIFRLQKNNLLHKWSQFKNIISVLSSYDHKPQALVEKVIEDLSAITELDHLPNFQFIQEQLQMLNIPPRGRRYSKNVLVLAAELLSTSPAAYRLLRNSNVILLPHEKLVRDLMTRSFQDHYIKSLIEKLQPKQRLVNILFDEVKLKRALRFSGGHILGHAANLSQDLATSALVFEMICHYGGPRLVIRIIPVSCLSAEQLKAFLLESASLISNQGGSIVSFICDNCPLNQRAYKLLGGPGKVSLQPDGSEVFLVYDYVHIFKNIRNNWITEATKELIFTKEGKEYRACWSDIVNLYNVDKQNAIRLTKLTYSSVYPKPLQRQSVQLVYQVFNEKTVAALKACQKELDISDGTITFISLISQWFTMMNVKDKYACVRLLDKLRSPWTLDSNNFLLLHELCETISGCEWQGGRIRQKKLTRFTARAFVLTTIYNINAAEYLLEKHDFRYVLPAVFSQDPLEKFFGQARQRFGGNFYIDINDVVVAGKVQRLHQLVKHDIIATKEDQVTPQCPSCDEEICESDVDLVESFQLASSEKLLESSDALKHKVVYIAGYLVRKYGLNVECEEAPVATEFLDELNHGGLCVPTLGDVYFVHCAVHLHEKLQEPRKHCGNYVTRLLSIIDSRMAQNKSSCHSLKNIIFKAYAANSNERERELGCLRRQEKLSN